MKHKRVYGEGLVIAAALLMIFAVCAALYVNRLPRRIVAEPVHAVHVEIPRLNVNAATLEELCGLEGIGETLARRILDYREENGGFRTVEELLNVEGIGEGKLGAFRDWVCVG